MAELPPARVLVVLESSEASPILVVSSESFEAWSLSLFIWASLGDVVAEDSSELRLGLHNRKLAGS